MGNEADLQAGLKNQIRQAFPTLKAELKFERYLHLRLGHHKITIDGEDVDKSGVKGRYDTAVFIGDKPLLLGEHKAPGVALTDEDVRQALSYARALEAMAPLVWITNGEEVRVVRTYDGMALPDCIADEKKLLEILQATAVLAAADSEDAIRTLLGNSPSVWSEILEVWNRRAIDARTGPAFNTRYPIAKGFQIPREVVKRVFDGLESGQHLIVLHGPPVSGITAVMAQLVGTTSVSPRLYIDGKQVGDVLQFIASRLSREMHVGISKDDLRQWLNTGQAVPGLTFLLDGVPAIGFDELVEFCEAGLCRMVVGMDSWTLDALGRLPGRSEQTPLGRASSQLELKTLSNAEFATATEILRDPFAGVFLHGANLVYALRAPKVLRRHAAFLEMVKESESISQLEPGQLMRLLAIPSIDFLEESNRMFGCDARLEHDLVRLSRAYLSELEAERNNADWIVESVSAPSIGPDRLEKALGEARLARLCDQGILNWMKSEKLGPRVGLVMTDLVAHYVSLLWSEDLCKFTKLKDAHLALKNLVKLSGLLPYGELALAAAIRRANSPLVFDTAIKLFVELPPVAQTMKAGTEFLVASGVYRGLSLKLDKDETSPVLDRVQPWLVLSHLAANRIGMEGSERSANAGLFAQLGNSEHLIFKEHENWTEEMLALHFHEIPGIGQLLCLNSGLIEPLSQAMFIHANEEPREFIALARFATDNKQHFLAWRILAVNLILKNAVDKEVRDATAVVENILGPWWESTIDLAQREMVPT